MEKAQRKIFMTSNNKKLECTLIGSSTCSNCGGMLLNTMSHSCPGKSTNIAFPEKTVKEYPNCFICKIPNSGEHVHVEKISKDTQEPWAKSPYHLTCDLDILIPEDEIKQLFRNLLNEKIREVEKRKKDAQQELKIIKKDRAKNEHSENKHLYDRDTRFWEGYDLALEGAVEILKK